MLRTLVTDCVRDAKTAGCFLMDLLLPLHKCDGSPCDHAGSARWSATSSASTRASSARSSSSSSSIGPSASARNARWSSMTSPKSATSARPTSRTSTPPSSSNESRPQQRRLSVCDLLRHSRINLRSHPTSAPQRATAALADHKFTETRTFAADLVVELISIDPSLPRDPDPPPGVPRRETWKGIIRCAPTDLVQSLRLKLQEM